MRECVVYVKYLFMWFPVDSAVTVGTWSVNQKKRYLEWNFGFDQKSNYEKRLLLWVTTSKGLFKLLSHFNSLATEIVG